jgi:hypothetical protein
MATLFAVSCSKPPGPAPATGPHGIVIKVDGMQRGEGGKT